jgi:isopenicillin N synthase-like dioxygenase
MVNQETVQEAQVVVIDWNDLANRTIENENVIVSALELAYGSTGTGIVAIRNVPGFVQAKHGLFSLAHELVQLPNDYLETNLTDKTSLYNSGWSFGKEKLGETPDTRKGSFYFNPITDMPGTLEDRQQYPMSYPKNHWPTDMLPGLEPAAKELGCLLTRVAVQVSQWIDRQAKRHCENYADDFLHESIKDTDKVKGRLLYYFPLEGEESKAEKEDSW